MVGDLVIDVSCFVFKRRLIFLRELLEEPEIAPSRLILADDLFSLFDGYIKKGKFQEDAFELIEELAKAWGYPVRPKVVLEWIQSHEFLEMLKSLFEKWRPVPASKIIGSSSSNPIDLQEIVQVLGKAGRVLYQELAAAMKAKTFLLALTRQTIRVLRRISIVIIEVPLAKKKKFMEKYRWTAGILFMLIFEISREELNLQAVKSLIEGIMKEGSPIVSQLLSGVEIVPLADTVFSVLAGIAIATVTTAIVFDSITIPENLLVPQ